MSKITVETYKEDMKAVCELASKAGKLGLVLKLYRYRGVNTFRLEKNDVTRFSTSELQGIRDFLTGYQDTWCKTWK